MLFFAAFAEAVSHACKHLQPLNRHIDSSSSTADLASPPGSQSSGPALTTAATHEQASSCTPQWAFSKLLQRKKRETDQWSLGNTRAEQDLGEAGRL